MHYRGRHRRQDQTAADDTDGLILPGIQNDADERTSDDAQDTRVVVTGPLSARPPGPDDRE
jgi:hypothetical protein